MTKVLTGTGGPGHAVQKRIVGVKKAKPLRVSRKKKGGGISPKESISPIVTFQNVPTDVFRYCMNYKGKCEVKKGTTYPDNPKQPIVSNSVDPNQFSGLTNGEYASIFEELSNNLEKAVEIAHLATDGHMVLGEYVYELVGAHKNDIDRCTITVMNDTGTLWNVQFGVSAGKKAKMALARAANAENERTIQEKKAENSRRVEAAMAQGAAAKAAGEAAKAAARDAQIVSDRERDERQAREKLQVKEINDTIKSLFAVCKKVERAELARQVSKTYGHEEAYERLEDGCINLRINQADVNDSPDYIYYDVVTYPPYIIASIGNPKETCRMCNVWDETMACTDNTNCKSIVDDSRDIVKQLSLALKTIIEEQDEGGQPKYSHIVIVDANSFPKITSISTGSVTNAQDDIDTLKARLSGYVSPSQDIERSGGMGLRKLQKGGKTFVFGGGKYRRVYKDAKGEHYVMNKKPVYINGTNKNKAAGALVQNARKK